MPRTVGPAPKRPTRATGTADGKHRRAPNGLGDDGRRLWASVAGTPWFAPSDGELLRHACHLADELTRLRALAATGPYDFHVQGGIRAAGREYVQALGLLGATPADRYRLGHADADADLDTLERRTLAVLRRGA